MRRAIILALAALPLVACGSFAKGSSADAKAEAQGSGTSRTYAVSNFSKVELKGSDDVKVAVGGAFAIRAEGPAKLLDEIEVSKDGDTLRIGRKKNSSFRWNSSDGKVTVYVTMPSITAASLAGSGDMSVDKVAGGDFDAGLAGSGDLSIGALQATKATLSIAGSGTITAGGQVQSLEASIAGSGDVAARGLKASKAEVSIAGSGNVIADVAGPAEVNLLGSGSADLGAAAKCEVNKVGSGSARCGAQ